MSFKQCPKGKIQDEESGKCYSRKYVIENPPKEIRVEMTSLKGNTRKQLSKDSWKKYHIYIGSAREDDESFDKLYYNIDLRSEMGLLYEDELDWVVFPKYYVDRNYDGSLDMEGDFTKMWKRLVEENNVLHVRY